MRLLVSPLVNHSPTVLPRDTADIACWWQKLEASTKWLEKEKEAEEKAEAKNKAMGGGNRKDAKPSTD